MLSSLVCESTESCVQTVGKRAQLGLVCGAKIKPLTQRNNNRGCKCDAKPNLSIHSEMAIQSIAKVARGDLLKGMNVHLIGEGPPASCEVNNFWIYFLSEVEGGSPDAKGVSESHTLAMGFEDGVNVHQHSGFDHGANITLIVSP